MDFSFLPDLCGLLALRTSKSFRDIDGLLPRGVDKNESSRGNERAALKFIPDRPSVIVAEARPHGVRKADVALPERSPSRRPFHWERHFNFHGGQLKNAPPKLTGAINCVSSSRRFRRL